MQLSKRLSSVASMVTAGYCLADVGTDHGYVPIYLYERQVVPKAIAMDINEGPLERARLHISESALSGVIETRLSDGLATLKPYEAESVVIAGMGGPLIIKILSAHPEVTASVKEFILQPQSEIAQVRRWLWDQGYEITEEHMVYEDGKYYPMFRAIQNPERPEIDALECRFGRLDVLKEPEVLRAFLEREIAAKNAILEELEKKATEKTKERSDQMKEMIQAYEEMLDRVLARWFAEA